MLKYIFKLIFLIYKAEKSFFVQEKEKKRQKVLKLLENKNVGTRLGSASDDETPSTSTKPKSALRSGKIHITSYTSNRKNNLNVLSMYFICRV